MRHSAREAQLCFGIDLSMLALTCLADGESNRALGWTEILRVKPVHAAGLSAGKWLAR
jgi:hypothetical protein